MTNMKWSIQSSLCITRHLVPISSQRRIHANFIIHFMSVFSIVGDKFKLFGPVSDTVFIVFMGAIEGLHLTAIGLLGHLLGFHIYLSK